MHTWDWFRKRRPGTWTTQGESKLILTPSSKRHLNYIHHHDISPKAQSFHGLSTCFVVYCPGLSLALFHCNLRRKTRILIYFCHKNEPHLYIHAPLTKVPPGMKFAGDQSAPHSMWAQIVLRSKSERMIWSTSVREWTVEWDQHWSLKLDLPQVPKNLTT